MSSTNLVRYCYPVIQLMTTIYHLNALDLGHHRAFVARESARRIDSYKLRNIGAKCDTIGTWSARFQPQ